MSVYFVKKRDGSVVPFTLEKITNAIHNAFVATGELKRSADETREYSKRCAQAVESRLNASDGDVIGIEEIQDLVEEVLVSRNNPKTVKAYVLYREKRRAARDVGTDLIAKLADITWLDAASSDVKRENANIDGDSAMGTMLKYGSESAKAYYLLNVISERFSKAHIDGYIHIHDLDFYTLTTTCCQIDLAKIFKGGFSTGHGYIREPNSVSTAADLAAIIVQANQNDQHGGQGIPFLDRDLAPYVKKSLRKAFSSRIFDLMDYDYGPFSLEDFKGFFANEDISLAALEDDNYLQGVASRLAEEFAIPHDDRTEELVKKAAARAIKAVDKETHQAMEGFVHNLNTMHSRAGAQVPFSSVNYGTDTSLEARMIVKNILKATTEGLGHGETPIFPIQVFRCKKGVNFEPGDPNYDLFELAVQCSAKRMYPNFSFQDAPFNAQFLDPNNPNTEIAYMGCRTRVISNVHDKDYQQTTGRGNLSFTSVNLPRLAIEACEEVDIIGAFKRGLDNVLELVSEQLLERYKIIANKKVYNYPFLMKEGVWYGSEQLKHNDTVGEVLKHGTLSIGFIGLAETLTLLVGEHHGESEEAQKLGLNIVKQMREFCDKKSVEMGMNFSLIATPGEGLSGRFLGIDRWQFGSIKGVTDKEYYTNSYHVPVSFDITAYDKIQIEAPYHALANAGHITYVELDGDPTQNIEALISIIRCMSDAGVGYGAINHPIDQDPVCNYVGIIGNECPKCGREDDGNPPFERIRRITGYLVGGLNRFNNAKRAEEAQRRKHHC